VNNSGACELWKYHMWIVELPGITSFEVKKIGIELRLVVSTLSNLVR